MGGDYEFFSRNVLCPWSDKKTLRGFRLSIRGVGVIAAPQYTHSWENDMKSAEMLHPGCFRVLITASPHCVSGRRCYFYDYFNNREKPRFKLINNTLITFTPVFVFCFDKSQLGPILKSSSFIASGEAGLAASTSSLSWLQAFTWILYFDD